ncbi:unnamed protein product [Anisakis simplex]|uniref:Uncharacterized protein n=1 Tax=Anisakis simplex TaxID=6269 RepID=A0A3P6NP37_ANISI|nr:unnamed protein product [Anisakis simplex]
MQFRIGVRSNLHIRTILRMNLHVLRIIILRYCDG